MSVLAIAVTACQSVEAGEVPLYEPAPSWIVPAPLPDIAKLTNDTPPIIIIDMQQRIENGRLWSYVDGATRIASSEMLAQLTNLTLPWAPDQGDLIVHELVILRAGERVDLLAKGQKLTVLRREQALEQRELTGILTATMAIEGLQVGDVLRVRASTTTKDDALAGRVQSFAQVIAAPVRVGLARLRFSWPTAVAPHWRILGEGIAAVPVKKGAYTELSFTLPAPKQPEMPVDSPLRYRRPPLIELSTFANWGDVSKVMAPLYVTKDLIEPGSPFAIEVAGIMKREATPIGRAQLALELVQDKIRYLAIGMNGGNYVPQRPAQTWSVRYGDCKAKTLLLLAVLHAMNITAEPVLANIGYGDLVVDRLPSAGAFNHILVRATIGGETLWLDGTASGSRIADIRDTPPFSHVLPVRTAGADILTIAMRPNARPAVDLSIDADESASGDIPSVFDATAVLRGEPAAMLTIAKAQLGAKEQREAVGQFFMGYMGEAQFSAASINSDPAVGTVTLTARGIVTTPWFTDDRKRKRRIARALDSLNFSPDRGRPSWTAIPVAAENPFGMRFRLRLKLPDGGRGYVVEGEPEIEARLAGYDMKRTMHVTGGIITIDERIDSTGTEVPANRIAAERDRVATAKARAPHIVAPDNAPRRWDLSGRDPAGATQVAAVDITLGKAIANDSEQTTSYVSRASFRSGIGDLKGALADLTRAIAIDPTVAMYLQRASVAYELGDLAASLTDAEEARKLDPASSDAIGRIAWLKAERGDLPGAIALLNERIELGGDTRAAYREAKASATSDFGDAAEAVKLYDELIAEKAGSPSLLNGRCWAKATRSIMLDTALKDCTAAIELSSNTIAALDSRALVWYRLGKYENALLDLNAVLAETPGLAQSRFLRGIVLMRLGRDAEAAKDLLIARRLAPSVDRTNARYGIKP